MSGESLKGIYQHALLWPLIRTCSCPTWWWSWRFPDTWPESSRIHRLARCRDGSRFVQLCEASSCASWCHQTVDLVETMHNGQHQLFINSSSHRWRSNQGKLCAPTALFMQRLDCHSHQLLQVTTPRHARQARRFCTNCCCYCCKKGCIGRKHTLQSRADASLRSWATKRMHARMWLRLIKWMTPQDARANLNYFCAACLALQVQWPSVSSTVGIANITFNFLGNHFSNCLSATVPC